MSEQDPKDEPQDPTSPQTQSDAQAQVEAQPEAQAQVEAQPDAQAQVEAQPEVPAEEAGPKLPDYGIAVEEAGVLKKKVTITVPRERIEAKREEMFGELLKSAQVPGFRQGHAPRRLIEKRFGKDVSHDVRNALVGDSLGEVVKKANLNTIGEPSLDLEAITVPDQGDLQYSFEVEVAPEFTLPEIKGIPLKRPKVEATDERIDRVLDEFRQPLATYEPSDAPAGRSDMITADARISGEGIEPVERTGLSLRVAPGQVEGLPLVDLGTALEGKKAGETAQVKVKVPVAHPNEAWREKELTVDLTIKSVQARKLPELDDAFAQRYGLATGEELRGNVRRNMQVRLDAEVRQSLRDQVCQYLMANTRLDVPAGAVDRQTDRLVQRRYVDLVQRGVPAEQINERLTELQAAASQDAVNELKLSFILGKIAEQEKIQVGDEEVNAQIAAIARQSNRRPERLKQEMQADGTFGALAAQLAEQQAVDRLIDQASIVDEESPPVDETPADEVLPAVPPAAETPGAETPAPEAPAEQPAAEAPAEQPAAEAPAEAPAAEAPASEAAPEKPAE